MRPPDKERRPRREGGAPDVAGGYSHIVAAGAVSGTELAVAAHPTLTQLASARQQLEQSRDLGQVKSIRDLATAAAVYAQAASLGEDAIRYAREVVLRAERRGGQLLAATPRQRPGEYKRSATATVSPALHELGISKDQSSAWQRIAAVPDADFEHYLGDGQPLSRDRLLKLATSGSIRGQHDGNEWYTPAAYIEAARTVLGGIDLDPASCAEANQVVRAARYYTAADDGLAQPWKGRVWLNPPYNGRAGDFADRLDSRYRAGDVTAAVMLLSAHSGETAWCQRLLGSYPICLTAGRISFSLPRGIIPARPSFGSIFAYLGPDDAAFAAGFARFGALLAPWRAAS